MTELVTTTISTGPTITGTVSSVTGAPIALTCVLAEPVVPDADHSGASACTGADGAYRITGLAPGEYILSATRPYDSDYIKSTYPGTVTLTDTATVTADFTLTMGGRIEGSILDDSGQPFGFSCAHVYRALAPGQIWPESVATSCGDPSGLYAVRSLEPGSYLVQASAMGGVEEYFEDAVFPTTATVVIVAAGAATTVDFRLAKAWSLVVSTKDSDSEGAISGIEVTSYADDGSPTLLGTTDSAGSLKVDVEQGSWVRVGLHDPEGRYVDWFIWSQPDLATADSTYLGPNSQIHVGAMLTRKAPPPSIFGTVLDDLTSAPLPGATVNAFAPTGDVPVASTTTDASGNFTLSPLPAGSYLVEVIPADPTMHLAEWFDNVSDRASATQVQTDGPVTALDIRLARARVSASGTLTDAQTGLPLAGVSVTAYPPAGTEPIATATTDVQGRYTIADLPPGVYTVRFEVAHYTPLDVNVGLTATRTDVDAALTPLPGSISGTITGAGGNKDRACVQVWALDGVTKVGAPVCVAAVASTPCRTWCQAATSCR